MVFAAVLSLVNKVFDVLPEFLIGVAVDVVVNEGDSLVSKITGVEDRFEQLLILAGVTVVIWLCESASDFAAHVMWRNLAQSIEHDTRMEVYAHVQTLEMSYFEDTTSGGMMTVLNDDVNQLERFLNAKRASLALDRDGNLLVLEIGIVEPNVEISPPFRFGGGNIRRVTPSGVVSTVANLDRLVEAALAGMPTASSARRSTSDV
mgnify:CR=1 FL=1